MTILAFFILLLPGLAWQAWFGAKRDLTSRLADCIGISLALPALVGLATYLFGWRFSGAGVIWLYGLAGILAGFPFFRRKTAPLLESIPDSQSPITNIQLLITTFLPLLLFALLLAFRFYQSRDLALPAWVDSVHHTLIVRLFLETGGVPPTAQPYIDAPFYYHFGFHLSTALYAFFASLSPDQAVLIFGQLLNAFVSLAMYRLGMALWNDPRRAWVAMLLTGFVFQMPGYYLTWGRYTLLTGVGLLIMGMAAALDVIHSSNAVFPNARSPNDREAAARLTVIAAGALLTHYFAAVLLALFFVTLILERMVFGRVRPWRLWKDEGLRTMILAGLAGFLMVSPWVWQVWVAGNQYFQVSVVAPDQSLDEVYFSGYLEYLWFLLGPYRSQVMACVGLAALVLVGWRKKTRPFAIWTVVFVILSLPWGVRLAPFRPDYGVIMVFFPAGMLIADAFLTPLEAQAPWFRWLARGTLAAALFSLLVWGVRETKDVVNPVTLLAQPEEVNALNWIETHTPEDANFFINVTYWQAGAYRGVDGGWWIMPVTGRRTFLPPVLYGFDAREDVLVINALAERAAQFVDCSVDFRAFLHENTLTYVYLGPNQGPLRPEALTGCAGLNVVYQLEGVTIYAVDLAHLDP